MQAQHLRTLVRLPDHSPVRRWLASPWGCIAWFTVRAVGGVFLTAAVVMIVGHVVGVLFDVKHPADPRTPGGPAEQDLLAFVALGTVVLGLVLSGWRMLPGSLVSLGGAVAFWAAVPELAEMAVLVGAIGAVNLVATFVGEVKDQHHHHEPDGPPPKRGHGRPTTRHPVGLVRIVALGGQSKHLCPRSAA
jgi:hypothetical protein